MDCHPCGVCLQEQDLNSASREISVHSDITWKELRVESQSAYEFPSGKEPRMKLDKAVFIRSGRRQRTTNIFWKGTRSRLALRYSKEEICTIRCVHPRRLRIPTKQTRIAIRVDNLYMVDVGVSSQQTPSEVSFKPFKFRELVAVGEFHAVMQASHPRKDSSHVVYGQ